MPKPWGSVPPWIPLLPSMGFLKDLKHQHSSNLPPSRIRDIYAPQEQWLYTWKGYSWKTCKVEKKSWKEILSVQPFSCHAVQMTAWPAQDGSVNPASWSEYRYPWLLLAPNLSSIYRHACTAQSRILLHGGHGAGSQLMQIIKTPFTSLHLG